MNDNQLGALKHDGQRTSTVNNMVFWDYREAEEAIVFAPIPRLDSVIAVGLSTNQSDHLDAVRAVRCPTLEEASCNTSEADDVNSLDSEMFWTFQQDQRIHFEKTELQ